MDDGVAVRDVPGFPGYVCGENGIVYAPSGRAVRTYDYDGSGLRWVSLDDGTVSYRGPVWYIVLSAWYRGRLDDVYVGYLDGNVANSAVNNLEVLFGGVQKGRKRGLNRR